MEKDSVLTETALYVEYFAIILWTINMDLPCEHVMLRIISFLVQFIKSAYLISSFSFYKVFSGNNKTEGKKERNIWINETLLK